MKDFIETQYAARVIQWNEPTDDGEGVIFSALYAGRFIQADSLALLLSALQDESHQPLMLAA